MELLAALGAIVLVNILAWITPGPNMIAVMAASLEHGRRHGIATGFGLAGAAFLWALLAVLGVTVLFELFPRAVVALKLAGALYLIWLGLRSLKSAMDTSGEIALSAPSERRMTQSVRNGFLVSMTNPKAALFFGSVMTAFIPGSAPDWFMALVVMLCGVLAAMLHAVTATVFSTAVAVRIFSGVRRWISAVFGVMFLGLGGSVAFAALRRQ
jgi:threonine/homoserine/homoserine lactone efflux protein